MIYITGDIHGEYDIHKLNSKSMKEKNLSLTENDFLIVTGDFGLPFTPKSIELYDRRKGNYYFWIKWLKQKPYTILYVDGNHDNQDWLSSLPTTEMFGGLVHINPHASNVIHLMRGQIYTIEGNTFFTMGGATTVDMIGRKKRVSWWPEEIPSNEELSFAIENLDKHNMSVDYVISHACGSSYLSDLRVYPDPDTLTSFFNHLEFDFGLKFKHWYFGHYHRDKTIDNKHTCLFREIIPIGSTIKSKLNDNKKGNLV